VTQKRTTREVEIAPLPISKEPSWADDREKYQEIASKIEPSVRIETKDKWYWKILAVFAAIFTFGGMSRKKFLESYGTTIGPIQGYPRQIVQLREPFLVHEARHTRQCRFFGFGFSPWLGLPVFVILYFLIPLPIGLAYGRYRLELDADLVQWRWMLSNGYAPNQIRDEALRRGKDVGGGSYGWSCPWSKWGYKRAAEKVIGDAIWSKYKKGV
jgi:hypothetical protein